MLTSAPPLRTRAPPQYIVFATPARADAADPASPAPTTTLHERLSAFCNGRSGGLDQRVPTAQAWASVRDDCSNEICEVTVHANGEDTDDVRAVAAEFCVTEHVIIEIAGGLKPASSCLFSPEAITAAHKDLTGEAALSALRLELRRVLWNSGSIENQVMFVCLPSPECSAAHPCGQGSASDPHHGLTSEIWVCVPQRLLERIQRKVEVLTVALGSSLHQRVRVYALKETDLAMHLPAPGDGRLRFAHDTRVFADAAPIPRSARVAIQLPGGVYGMPVDLRDARSTPPKPIEPGKYRSTSAGGYLQIGDGCAGRSAPVVVVDTCGHPFRREDIGAVVLKDTRMDPRDASNDISISPIAISFPGLSTTVPGHYGDFAWNNRAVPGTDYPPQPLPLRAVDCVLSAVDFGIYRIGGSGGPTPLHSASDMEPQPSLSKSLAVRLGRMTNQVLCLPDSHDYMGSCRFHGINTPGNSSNLLNVIGFGEKVLSISMPGLPGFTSVVEVTYIALSTGGAAPDKGDSGGDVLKDVLSGEALLHSFICSRAELLPPSSAGGPVVAPAPAPPAIGTGAGGPYTAATTAPNPALVSARADSAYALLERASGGLLYTLTPAHIALGYVVSLQADPDSHLPPGPVTFVRPTHALAGPQLAVLPAMEAAGGAGQG